MHLNHEILKIVSLVYLYYTVNIYINERKETVVESKRYLYLNRYPLTKNYLSHLQYRNFSSGPPRQFSIFNPFSGIKAGGGALK